MSRPATQDVVSGNSVGCWLSWLQDYCPVMTLRPPVNALSVIAQRCKVALWQNTSVLVVLTVRPYENPTFPYQDRAQPQWGALAPVGYAARQAFAVVACIGCPCEWVTRLLFSVVVPPAAEPGGGRLAAWDGAPAPTESQPPLPDRGGWGGRAPMPGHSAATNTPGTQGAGACPLCCCDAMMPGVYAAGEVFG